MIEFAQDDNFAGEGTHRQQNREDTDNHQCLLRRLALNVPYNREVSDDDNDDRRHTHPNPANQVGAVKLRRIPHLTQ